MTFSIRARIHEYAASFTKVWKHDRSKTVGASEIGQCARKTYFDKHGVARDEGYVAAWGAQARGTIIENAFWVPALRATMRDGEQLLFAGDGQHTIESGYLSATTDGLVTFPERSCINLDCKSIDPRADISKEKSAHHFQVQAQMGLIRECTPYKPDTSILSYINASFWDDVTEFVIPFSPRIYAQAHARATQIMTAREATALPPEGKMAGGDECEYCAWSSRCAAVTVAGVPRERREISGDASAQLVILRNMAIAARNRRDEADRAHQLVVEEIKQFMRGQNTRAYKGDGWSVSYSAINGRATLDMKAVEDAGIDLTPFYKVGDPSERLTIK